MTPKTRFGFARGLRTGLPRSAVSVAAEPVDADPERRLPRVAGPDLGLEVLVRAQRQQAGAASFSSTR